MCTFCPVREHCGPIVKRTRAHTCEQCEAVLCVMCTTAHAQRHSTRTEAHTRHARVAHKAQAQWHTQHMREWHVERGRYACPRRRQARGRHDDTHAVGTHLVGMLANGDDNHAALTRLHEGARKHHGRALHLPHSMPIDESTPSGEHVCDGCVQLG